MRTWRSRGRSAQLKVLLPPFVHSGEGRDPLSSGTSAEEWVRAFAGMTDVGEPRGLRLHPPVLMTSQTQLSLLDESVRALPEGFEYRPELVTPQREAELIERFRTLDFKPFEFHGYFGNRRVVSFG